MESIQYYYLSNMTRQQIRNSYSIRNYIKHDGLYEEQKFYKKKALIEKKMMSCTDNIIVENEWAKNHCLYINPNARLYIHHQNVDAVFFNKNWNYDNCNVHSIFTCAPIYPLKGFHILIQALEIVKRKYSDVKLIVPGIADPFGKRRFIDKLKRQGYEKYCMNLIESFSLQNNIVFMGRLDSKGMADQMEKANVMVVPSSIENTSTTLREAMAVGTPCIGSYVGGIPETIRHGENGFLFRHEEFIQLASYIIQIFDNKDLAEKFCHNGKKHMRSYLDANESTEQLINIYKDVIRNEVQ